MALKLHEKLKHKDQATVKTVKEKSESEKGEETEHLSETGMGNSRLLIEQNWFSFTFLLFLHSNSLLIY